MNLEKLFTMQQQLDDRIVHDHNLNGRNLLAEKIVALQVELAELANETRCFKYWSKKPSAERTIILEEYVDGIHFLLSLGLACDYRTITITDAKPETDDLVYQFGVVFDGITTFKKSLSKENYEQLFREYTVLGSLLGFATSEVEQAYVKKNIVNHERQDQGY
ncbi:dUTP diphosphatase [Desertibacillus haloalkaliphilus]|uniref:dUTP diphosphatase n=1 Tax=Desertibacillus haloalkaliphilus TaxID=1328930 RepID=UPI001C26B4FB|nr:dUTP diphosphatase [Desertibacillus haloalkaliphilus]MBU8905128.1 dUTP diphosphatase [Desertibacillus haloalkaliphilus]